MDLDIALFTGDTSYYAYFPVSNEESLEYLSIKLMDLKTSCGPDVPVLG